MRRPARSCSPIRPRRAIDALLARAAAARADVDVTADDGVRHQLWVIDDDADDRRRSRARSTPCRRSISPTAIIARPRPRAWRRRAAAAAASHGYFLAVLLPHHQMTILDYNRVLRDLNGRSAEQLLAEIARALRGRAVAISRCGPRARTSSAWFSAGRWYRLTLRPELAPSGKRRPGRRGCRSRCSPATSSSRFSASPIRARDKRIDFVGGGRGLAELERLVAFRRDGGRRSRSTRRR